MESDEILLLRGLDGSEVNLWAKAAIPFSQELRLAARLEGIYIMLGLSLFSMGKRTGEEIEQMMISTFTEERIEDH